MRIVTKLIPHHNDWGVEAVSLTDQAAMENPGVTGFLFVRIITQFLIWPQYYTFLSLTAHAGKGRKTLTSEKMYFAILFLFFYFWAFYTITHYELASIIAHEFSKFKDLL